MAQAEQKKQNDELKELDKWVENALELTQRQVENIGDNYDMLLLSTISLGATLAIQVVSKLLIIWVPTSFFLAVLWIIWSQLSGFKAYLDPNKYIKLAEYDKLSDKQKELGIETSAKRLDPLSYALAAVYLIAAIILVLYKSGVVGSPTPFSIWLPLASFILLTVWIGAGPLVLKSLPVRPLDIALKRSQTKFAGIAMRRIISLLLVALFAFVLTVGINAVLPIWSLVSTQHIYIADTNWLLILLFLVLQLLVWAQIAGYLSYLSARTELSTNVANLSNLSLRINQLLHSKQKSTDEVAILTEQYHEAIKYRFVHILILRFFRLYMPVLNTAYVQAHTSANSPTPDEEQRPPISETPIS